MTRNSAELGSATEEPSPTVDLVLAAVAGAAAVLGFVQGPRTALVVVCLLCAVVPWALVAAGRRLPLGLFAVLAIAPVLPLVTVTGIRGGLFLTTAACSRVACRTDRRPLLAGTTAAVILLPFTVFLVGKGDPGAGYFAFGNSFGVLAGVQLRRTARLAGELRAAGVRLAEAASREDRLRLARDVHDLVAHSLTVVVLHVTGARLVLRTEPDSAESALAAAERVCRESLDGIREVVGLLRKDDRDRRVLSLDLDELAETYRAAGLQVAVSVRGDLAQLPLVTRLTLHRVVQEALTNAARHAGGATAVEVSLADHQVVARVSNPMPQAHQFKPTATGGFGLLGLREQVGHLGGDLTGGAEAGQWVVRCRLPRLVAQPTGTRQ